MVRSSDRRRKIIDNLVMELDKEISYYGYATVGGKIPAARHGVSSSRLSTVVKGLEEEGFNVWFVPAGDGESDRAIKVLTNSETTYEKTVSDRETILKIAEYDPDLGEILSLRDAALKTRSLYEYLKTRGTTDWDGQTIGERRTLSVAVAEAMKTNLKKHPVISISKGSESRYGVHWMHVQSAVRILTKLYSGYRTWPVTHPEKPGLVRALAIDEVTMEELDRLKDKIQHP